MPLRRRDRRVGEGLAWGGEAFVDDLMQSDDEDDVGTRRPKRREMRMSQMILMLFSS